MFSWFIGLCAALIGWSDGRCISGKNTATSFESFYDRIASWFKTEDAPLIAHWRRFYLRNRRFRLHALLTSSHREVRETGLGESLFGHLSRPGTFHG